MTVEGEMPMNDRIIWRKEPAQRTISDTPGLKLVGPFQRGTVVSIRPVVLIKVADPTSKLPAYSGSSFSKNDDPGPMAA
jgi:hypothetical protein